MVIGAQILEWKVYHNLKIIIRFSFFLEKLQIRSNKISFFHAG